MYKKAFILSSCLVFFGCNSTEETLLASNDDGYKCEKVVVLGSSIPQKYCSTKKQRDEYRKNGQEGLRNTQVSGILSGDSSSVKRTAGDSVY